MLKDLAEIYDKNLGEIYDKEANRLVRVSYALFDGEPNFITAVEMHFESFFATFRAIADDDTLTASLGAIELDSDELLVDVSKSEPWSQCLGSRMPWLWRLTNQQGYDDGVRIEFTKPGENFTFVVEFIVMASAIQIFSAARHETI
jgi:uncharacterized protein DUF6334